MKTCQNKALTILCACGVAVVLILGSWFAVFVHDRYSEKKPSLTETQAKFDSAMSDINAAYR
jgi:hypothetical protein